MLFNLQNLLFWWYWLSRNLNHNYLFDWPCASNECSDIFPVNPYRMEFLLLWLRSGSKNATGKHVAKALKHSPRAGLCLKNRAKDRTYIHIETHRYSTFKQSITQNSVKFCMIIMIHLLILINIITNLYPFELNESVP